MGKWGNRGCRKKVKCYRGLIFLVYLGVESGVCHEYVRDLYNIKA